MRTWFQNLPLQRRMRAIMLLTSGTVLLLTCGGLFAYEILTFRHATVRQLSAVAAVLANNSTAALAFEDREGAGEILAALKAENHVVAAGLYDARGVLFSTYPVGLSANSFPAAPESTAYRFANSFLTGFQPVVLDGKRLGTLFIRANTEAMSERFRLYILVAGGVATVAFLLASLLSRVLQRQISAPILALADTARAVSERRDYSVRAPRIGTAELGLLTEAVNHMLTRIQDQMARMELLNRVTRSVGERMDTAGIFQVVVRTLEESLPVDFAAIFLLDSSREQLTVASVGAKGEGPAQVMGMSSQALIPVDENGLKRCAQGQLVYEPDVAEVPFPFSRRLAGQGLRALVISPLIVENDVFAVLAVARKEANSFSSLDCEFLRQLSEHAALAAHQARLHGALEKAYEDLRQSQQTIMQQERLRALGQMASGIAHDINNAILPVVLYTESLLESEELSPRARDYLQTISHAIEDVASTVGRMREFYRQRASESDLVPVQLNRCLQQVIDMTRARWHDMPQRQGHVIRVVAELDPNLPAILGVEGEIREALTNLYLNAFDAMPQGGTLTLRTRSGAKRQVDVEILDTGVGMDEETRRRCMEPFFTTKGERGTGLGLAMVYGVLKRHGAGLDIVSAPGRGTLVRLTFPIPDVLPQPVPAPPPIASRPLRILVVDDDLLVLKSLKHALGEDAHEVTTADGGQAGIDAFLASLRSPRGFDIVITDLGMPQVDGRQVAAAIKQASPATPVILLTGWGQGVGNDSELPLHVDRILGKPPKRAALRETLAQLCPPDKA